MATILVVVDLDGVVSPVHGATVWGNDVVAGLAFGPVAVSPTVCGYLDKLAAVPGVECAWLTSWSPRARAGLDPFPGREWRTVGEPPMTGLRGWWKLAALEKDLGARPTAGPNAVTALVWLDDHLANGARAASVRRRLARFDVQLLLVAPATGSGLTPADLSDVEAFVAQRATPAHRVQLEEAWRTSPLAPCGCGWDGWHCPHCGSVTARSGDAWSPAHTRSCHPSPRFRG